MRITLTITDTPEGAVRIDCDPPASELLELEKSGRLGTATSAAMYALGMCTWAATRSREMRGKESSLIVLPPGVRS